MGRCGWIVLKLNILQDANLWYSVIYYKTIQFHINIFSQNSKGVPIQTLVVDFKGLQFWNTMCQRCVLLYYMHRNFQLVFYYMVYGQFSHVWWFCRCTQARPNCWRILFWRSSSSNYFILCDTMGLQIFQIIKCGQ